MSSVIIPNDNVINHFASVYGLSSRAGVSLEEQLFQESVYREARLGDLLRACFGGVANNPSKSLVFLATDYNPKTKYEIARDSNGLLGVGRGNRLKRIYCHLIKGYFNEAILKLSYFAGEGKRREKRGTELAGVDVERLLWGDFITYFKTWDGFLFGDDFAHLGLSSSVIDGARSGYKVWGVANTRGGINAQEFSLLLLYWLKEKGRVMREIDVIREVFGFKEKSPIPGTRHSLIWDRSYRRFRSRFRSRLKNINRLKLAGVIGYEGMTPKEEIITELEKGLSLGRISLQPSPKYSLGMVKRVIECLEEGAASNSELANKTGFEISSPRRITKALREKGYARLVSGKDRGHFSAIKLLPAGERLVEVIDPLMRLIGWHDAMNAVGGVKYSMLEQVVKPDLAGLWRYRAEHLDSVVSDEQAYLNFVTMAREARERHIEDRPQMSRKERID